MVENKDFDLDLDLDLEINGEKEKVVSRNCSDCYYFYRFKMLFYENKVSIKV